MLSPIFVKREPFTEAEIARLKERCVRVPGTEPRWGLCTSSPSWR